MLTHHKAHSARKAAFEEAAKIAERIGRKHQREADRMNRAERYDALEQFETLADQALYIAGLIRRKR